MTPLGGNGGVLLDSERVVVPTRTQRSVLHGSENMTGARIIGPKIGPTKPPSGKMRRARLSLRHGLKFVERKSVET
jgi:hypothetical protein